MKEPNIDPVRAIMFPAGEYTLQEVVGTGGMATVFKAVDGRRRRTVAVKVLRADVANALGVHRFTREIEIAASFAHPHILSLLDSGVALDANGHECPYYVMPLIEGQSLRERIHAEKKLSLDDTLRIAREVLEALGYAHARGVLHRDIKPANILLSEGSALVADFGVALPFHDLTVNSAVRDRLTQSGFAVGTPVYMSPEQALADKTVDARTDLYAVGCLIYEMLTGVTPFEANTAQAILARKISGIFVPVSSYRVGLPPQLNEIIQKALQPEQSDRFTSAAEFLNALRTVDRQSTTYATVPATDAPGFFRRWQVWSVGALVVFAVIALVALDKKGEKYTSVSSDRSRVAILPLEVITADSILPYVANGLTTDLIDELAQYPALTVISKSGVAPFHQSNASIDSIARLLKVGSVVSGDVRRFGDSVRVTVRLIDGQSSVQLSKADAVGSLRDMLVVRSKVIDTVTKFLRTEIGAVVSAKERQNASNAEAWELVARAKLLAESTLQKTINLGSTERDSAFASVDAMLRRASRLDSKWVSPMLMRARIKAQQANIEESLIGTKAESKVVELLRSQAIEVASEALARFPNEAQAFAIRGTSRLDLWRTSRTSAPDSLRDGAESDLTKAVSLRNDMAESWSDLSTLFQYMGNYEESRVAAENAIKADAFLKNRRSVTSRLLFAELATGKISQAQKRCRDSQIDDPSAPQFWGCELTILGWTGSTSADVSRAWEVLQLSEARDSLKLLQGAQATRRLFIAAIAAKAGMADSARSIIASVNLPNGRQQPSDQILFGEAHVQALLNRADLAIPMLHTYLKNNPALRGQVYNHPWFASLKNDPQFRALLQQQ